MNSSPWPPYNQQPFLSGGSPHLPPVPHEDTLNNYGGGSSNSFLASSCQDLQTLSSRSNADSSTLLSSSNFESLISPTLQSSKVATKFYNDGTFNGVCKENQSEMQNFMQMQCSDSRNEGDFPSSENTANYVGQVQSINFNPSNIDHPSPSLFGPLPHLTVKPPIGRSNENFISPVSKTASAYNNGPYTDRENNNIYTNPHSVQSSYSGEASPSPATRSSLTSSNFSSPSTDFNYSPQTLGAYHSGQSPSLPTSPSVTHQSHPSSPYTNIDTVALISSATPCSPMNGGTYVNNLNGVPSRNGLQKQQQPNSNNSAVTNNVCYNASQSHHGPQSGLSKTPDYHPEYNVYAPGRISPSSSYSSGYSSMHSGPMCNGNNSRLSPRLNSNLQHEVQMRYGPSRTVSSAAISSPTYLLNKPSHEISYASGSMQHNTYMPCPSSIHAHSFPVQSQMLSNNIGGDGQFDFPNDMVGDRGALDLFNSHLDNGAPSQDQFSHLITNDYPGLSTESVSNTRQRSLYGNANRSPVQFPIINDQLNSKGLNAKYAPLGHSMDNVPRGRRGRKPGRKSGGHGFRGRGRRNQSWREEPYHGVSVPQIDELGIIQPFKKEIVESNPPSLSTRGLKTSDINDLNNNNSVNNSQPIVTYGPYNMNRIKEEIGSLMQLPPPQKRNLRSCNKRESQFQENYRSFVKNRKPPLPGDIWPPRCRLKKAQIKDKKRESRDLGKLKMKIKLVDPKKPNEWCCLRGTSESPLTVPDDDEDDGNASAGSELPLLSSQEIKQEIESEEESNHTYETGKLSKVTEKHSAKRKNIFKSNDQEHHLNVTNSETLPAGKVRVRSENASSINSDEQEQHTETKKCRRNSKKESPVQTETNTQRNSLENPEPSSNSSVFKRDQSKGDEERLRVLRSSNNTPKEPKSGSSSQEDASDDNIDDSDCDSTWTPGSKAAKAADAAKSFGVPSRIRGPKVKRRKSRANSNPPHIKRNTKSQDSRSKKMSSGKPKSTSVVRKGETSSRGRKDTGTDRFLIAKADINLPTPFIWKVDSKSSMLQRFEISEQNGVLLYHSSFTYAANNEICVNNYVTADVKVLSPDTVQYLGPNLSEAAAISLSEIKPVEHLRNDAHLEEENFDHLKEDFTVYIQSLLSQDVDSSFLHEIKKFNDEYFLIPIQNVESISDNKKGKLLKEFWSEELRKCINTYPNVNILDSAIDSIKCQACDRNQGNKLLQFFGQAYDWTTLELVDLLNAITKTQFSVCDNCSISVSLYNRLHHHKYNLFVECHSKASEVKANNDNLQSHEDVLKLCLEDTAWIEKIFAEQIQIWRDCEKNS